MVMKVTFPDKSYHNWCKIRAYINIRLSLCNTCDRQKIGTGRIAEDSGSRDRVGVYLDRGPV